MKVNYVLRQAYACRYVYSLLAFESERRIENPNLQVDALTEASSEKTKARSRAALGHLIDTLKFVGQLNIPF